MPHIMYGYVANTYEKDDDELYNLLLGVLWIPFGYNFVLYVAQTDRFSDAYKFYFQEKLRPMVYKERLEETRTTPYKTARDSRN